MNGTKQQRWLCDGQRSEEKKAAASATTPPCQPDRSAMKAAAPPTKGGARPMRCRMLVIKII
jgi:hypothetical protein